MSPLFRIGATPLVAAAALAAMALLQSSAVAVPPDKGQTNPPHVGNPIHDQWIVTLLPGKTLADVKGRHGGCGSISGLKHEYTAVLNGFAVGLNSAQYNCLTAPEQSDIVESVEQDRVSGTSGWLFPAPWGLDRIDQLAFPLNQSYGSTGAGAGTRVYVVDTGVRADHEEFGERVRSIPSPDPALTTDDENGHGTHVAGIAAGATTGVAPAASIVSVRVLNASGQGPVSTVIAGLDAVLADHLGSPEPAVVNVSISAFSSRSLNRAVAKVVSSGIPVVVAAGNSTMDACSLSSGVSPASEPTAITVAGTDESDRRVPSSNWGPCVDIFAPGNRIESADHDSPLARALRTGTSMATAFVSGAVARLMSSAPGPAVLAPTEISAALANSATAGVVSDPGAGSPNRLLFLPPPDGGFVPPASASLGAPGASSSASSESSAGARAMPRILKAKFKGKFIYLSIYYGDAARVEVLRNTRVVMRTSKRDVKLRASKGRAEILRVRSMSPAAASTGISNKAVRVGNSIRITQG